VTTGVAWPARSIVDLEAILRRVPSQGGAEGRGDSDLKPGCVLVLFTATAEGPSIVLTRRSLNVSAHRGEIAFPGGKPELEDKSSVDTALRETEEEIGIARSDIDVWGGLPAVSTVGSGFRLEIHTGFLKRDQTFRPAPGEVAEVFMTPVSHLDNPANFRSERIMRDGQIVDRPSYSYNGRVIWGATARIIDQMLDILRSP